MSQYDDEILLVMDKPVSFHPELATLFKSVESALLFQQLYFWRDKGGRDDGFIYKTKKQISDETYLNRYQQDKARAELEKLGVIETQLMRANGSPVIHYRVNVRRTNELLAVARLTNGKVETSDSKESRLVDGELMETSKMSDSISRSSAQIELMETSKMSDSITETTTDTTTNNTTDMKKNIKKKPAEPKATPEHTILIEYVASIQNTTFKANFLAQTKAASAIIKSGVTLEEAMKCADLMRQDEYWRTKLFDVNTLRNQLYKYLPKAQEVKQQLEAERNRVEYWYDYKLRNTIDDLRPGLSFTLTPEQAHELETMWDDEYKPTYRITIVEPEGDKG